MKKLLTTIIICLALIFTGLSTYKSLDTSGYSFLNPAIHNDSIKPVVYDYHNYNRHFISELPNYTYAAHRGAPAASKKPENSLAAFRLSKKLGFEIVETDLQLTKDGQWVIIHDCTLDRTTTGKGILKSFSLSDIEKFKLRGSEKESLSVPTLDDFLKLCSSERLIPILDIKPNEHEISSKTYSSLLACLDKYDLLDKSIFCSSSKVVLSELRSRDYITAIAVMRDVSRDDLNFVKELNNAFFYCNYIDMTDAKIDLINKNGLQYGVWTINDGKTAQYFLKKGAIMIVTDKLQRIISEI